MILVKWFTKDNKTCYNYRSSDDIIDAISTGYTKLLNKENLVKFVIFDEFSNIVFSGSKDCTTYALGLIKNLM